MFSTTFRVLSRQKKARYKLGRAQLNASQIPEAIESYLKAENASDWAEVGSCAAQPALHTPQPALHTPQPALHTPHPAQHRRLLAQKAVR